jgi:GxxExxY protein
MTGIPHTDITYRIIGAAMAVHNELGVGLPEVMYHRALWSALQRDDFAVEFEKQVEIRINDEFVGYLYLDLLVADSIVVEAKAVPHLLTSEEIAQVLTYLAVTGASVGLLLNFGRHRLEYKRVLPPKQHQDWRTRVRRYVWRPQEMASAQGRASSREDYPLIRSLSVDDHGGAN